MSKTQHLGSTTDVTGHGAIPYQQLLQIEPNEVIAVSRTSETIRRRKSPKVLILTPLSVTGAPINGSSLRLLFLFAAALEDVITQIWILERCNNELAVLKTKSDINYFKCVKYGVYDPNDIKDELDGIDPHNLNCMIYKVKKLDMDRKYVKQLMIATYMSLGQSLTYDPLVKGITSIEDLQHYRTALLEKENKNKMIRKDLCKQVTKQRNYYKTVLYDTETIIDKLRTEVEDSVLYTEVRSRYMSDWQVARTEQHTQTIFDTENGSETKLEYYKQRHDHEIRVHTEVETLVSIIITEKLQEVDLWMNKYDEDMEHIDLKIQIKKNASKDMRDKRIGYEEKLKTREKQMKDWIGFKTAREKQRIYNLKMFNSATIVQAWWRGLLVRRQLGPYRSKKTKKGKK